MLTLLTIAIVITAIAVIGFILFFRMEDKRLARMSEAERAALEEVREDARIW